MKHIEEHILERFVNDPQSIGASAKSIEKHLAECHGCRETEQRIRIFYAALYRRLENVRSDSSIGLNSVISVEQRISSLPVNDLQVFEELPLSFWGKLAYTVKKHPIAAGGSTLTVLGLFTLFIFTLMPSRIDASPDYLRIDTKNSLIEVRNKKNEKLWALAVENINSVFGPEQGYEKKVILNDVDLDGEKELLITATLADKRLPSQKKMYAYNSDGTERFSFIPENHFIFRGRTYNENFVPRSLELFSINHKENIIALSASNGRSPSIISFLDNLGNVVGEYSHFGNISSLFIDTLESGKQVLILNGTCDILEFDENSSKNYSVTIVLDPLRIKEKSESSNTRGSGKTVSTAELYYIRYPLSDIDKCFNNVRTGAHRGNDSNKGFIITSKSGSDTLSWDFDFTFNRSMEVTTVKSSDGTYQIHDSLKKMGYLNSTIDSAYLANLKNHVEYWDGKRWHRTPVSIVLP